MRVALLSFFSFDEVKGGTELFCEQLRQVFPDLTLITYGSASTSLPRLDRLNLQEPRMGLALGRRFNRLVREEDFDLVICNSVSGWWLSVVRPDLPIINVFHYTMIGLAQGTLRGTPGYLPSRYFSSLFERLTARSKVSVAVSQKVRRELRDHYGIGARVVENGISLEQFRPTDRKEARERLGLDRDGPVGIFVGRADHTKGFDIVEEFARRRPDIKLVCVTPSAVDGAGLIVRRNVPHALMPLYYSASDFLLFPSRYESFGYTALEAMACDVPVIASRTGIFEDLEDGRLGAVIGSYDPGDYVAAADRVLDGPGWSPRSVVGERFSLERFAEQYRALARGVVSEHEERALRSRPADPART